MPRALTMTAHLLELAPACANHHFSIGMLHIQVDLWCDVSHCSTVNGIHTGHLDRGRLCRSFPAPEAPAKDIVFIVLFLRGQLDGGALEAREGFGCNGLARLGDHRVDRHAAKVGRGPSKA